MSQHPFPARLLPGLFSNLLLIPLLFLCGCAPKTASTAKGPGSIPVQTAKVERRTLNRTHLSVGTVNATRTVAIKSQVDGVLQTIHFKEGDLVRQGDLLITLDRRPFENGLAIAKAELANARAEAQRAEADFVRYTHLLESGNVSEELMVQISTRRDTTRASMLSREAAVANAELLLGYAEIKAPFPGRTGQVSLHEGALVKANDSASSLLLVNQIDPIEVAYSMPERLLPSLRSAMAGGPVPVTATPQADGAIPSRGSLIFLNNEVDTSTGTVLLKASFQNADGALWPGQFVQVETVLGSDVNALVVPIKAVQTGQQGSQVFVVKSDQSVELRLVKVARISDGLALLESGLAEGERIVTGGQLRLTPGARIEERSLEQAIAPSNKESK